MDHAGSIPGQVFGSVWDALEDSPAEGGNMRIQSALRRRAMHRGWTRRGNRSPRSRPNSTGCAPGHPAGWAIWSTRTPWS